MTFLYSTYHYLWSMLGAWLQGFPSRKLVVIGATGTKGKSTMLALLAHILAYAGKKVALVTSTHIQIGDHVERNTTGNSMPGRMFLQSFLARARRAGCEYALIEVTSEGIVQHRHRFIAWDDAVFLDIHPEHLERHGSFRDYLLAKISFFSYVAKKCTHKKKKNICPAPAFFAYAHDSHTHLFEHAARPYNTVLFSDKELEKKHVEIPETLPGDFNRINVAAALAIAQYHGIAEETACAAVASFPGLLGRMTIVSREPVYAVVDYAHTPDSLQAVYAFLKSKIKNQKSKLICVLGAAGGGRDKWKRSVMGGIAARYCSTIVLTNEDPFDEDPMQIIRDVKRGVEQTGFRGDLYEIDDRREAIEKAVELAREGDALVCTGKGSENAIRVARGKKIPWSESEFVFAELQRQGKYRKL
jgi:UDP-N-acetylmuramoyl-L-alanyl-D-glutamate--2,6-diaminopimelate ligase